MYTGDEMMYVYKAFSVTAPTIVQLSSDQYMALESSGIVCVTVMANRQAREPFSVFLMPMSVLQQQSASSE